MSNQPNPDDLIMVEPLIKRPSLRAKKGPEERNYLWYHRGEKIKMNENRLRERIKNVKMVCTVEMFIVRLWNSHSVVVNTATGEVFDGTAFA